MSDTADANITIPSSRYRMDDWNKNVFSPTFIGLEITNLSLDTMI